MRIRRSVTTLVTPTGTLSSDATLSTSNLSDCQTTPSRCTTTANSSSLVCVLNQSPWDVADPSSQVDGGLFSLTGTSIAPEFAEASQSYNACVKLSGDNWTLKLSGDNWTLRHGAAAPSDKNSCRKENIVRSSSQHGKIRAEKNKCSTVLSSKPQIRSSGVKQQLSTDPTPQPEMTRRRGRPAKKSAANPNEFYYYSGFGPHWGKKRDGVNKRPPPPATQAPKTVIAVELNNELHSQQVEGRGRDVEFVDFDDDGDENDEGISRGSGRKRVKARSLKSLM